MANVTQYHILFYGGDDGYRDCRAQIGLNDGDNNLGYVRFHDSGMPFPSDSQSGGQIIMHLPSSMFKNVLNVLRNEKPIDFYFVSGRAFLGTGYSTEPVGEGE